ncbi:unnamed protein product [Laminaria digitata]
MEGLVKLMEVALFNTERTAELLIEEEANDSLGMTPLLKAATLGLLSAVKDPLAAGMDANFRYGTDELSLLDVAALMGHLEVMRALLEHGVDVSDANAGGYTPLLHPVQYGREDLLADVIDLLLSAGADINAPTARDFTPLHLVSYRQHSEEITATLLQRGAAKDAVMRNGRSPLHTAAQVGNLGATRAASRRRGRHPPPRRYLLELSAAGRRCPL